MVDKIAGLPGTGLPEERGIDAIQQKRGVSQQQKIERSQPAVSFEELLKQASLGEKQEAIKFSGHAIERVRERNIITGQNTLSRLESAIEKARNKGAKECVVLMDDNAYVVSVKNRTVVTAISKDELKERIFTSIDSVIVV